MKRSRPKRSAAGLPSVIKALQKTMADMGPARTVETLLRVNQKDGFDCPGCAWPDRDSNRATFEFCENGAKAVADEATTHKITREFFAKYDVATLSAQPDVWLNAQGRLTEPMLLDESARYYTPIGWNDAFRLLAGELKALASPDQAVFYTSGRTSNEAAFLYQLFVRMYGTNNLPDCSNLCHESSGEALRESIGTGKGCVTLDDFQSTDAIFIIGQNPGTNHPRMMATLQAAARRGCEIVSINPLPEAGLIAFRHPQQAAGLLGFSTPLTSLFLPVRINGDVALLKGIMKEMLQEEKRRPGEILDKRFIEEFTCGFDSFAESLEDVSWADITAQSGIDRQIIRQAAEVAMRSRATIVCWAMGLTQHENAVANVQEIVNFLLLRGNIGRRGAGPCPVRGHSNVQGDRTMGIWERPTSAFLDRLGAEFRFSAPRHHGLDTVSAIRAMLDGRAKVLFALGGNFFSASPDTESTAAALRQCRLTAHVSTKLNRAHLVTGKRALILPCLGRTERDNGQFVTTENSMGVISRSQGTLAPASPHLLSEVDIVARLASSTLGIDWSHFAADYNRIRDHISRVIPGFEDFNGRISRNGNFLLPNSARERRFLTPSGRAQFTRHPLPSRQLQPGEFFLTTIRSHDQFNTTIYSLDDRYRGIHGGRHVVFLHADDIRDEGLRDGENVDLVSCYNGHERVAHAFTVVAYPIPRRCAAAYFPEANVLVPVETVAERSNTPVFKSIVIRLRRLA